MGDRWADRQRCSYQVSHPPELGLWRLAATSLSWVSLS
jgi:hypothetical protein